MAFRQSSERVQAAWNNVRAQARRMLSEGLNEELKSPAGTFDLEQLQEDIDILTSTDPHQLLRRLESLSHEHVMKIKVDIWPCLVTPDKTPALTEVPENDCETPPESIDKSAEDARRLEQTTTFLKLLMDNFTLYQDTIRNMSQLFKQLDAFLNDFGISWKVINHHIFDEVIYHDIFLTINIPLMEKILGCQLRVPTDDTPEEQEARRLKEKSLNLAPTVCELAHSFRILHKLMNTSRQIFDRADVNMREYAKKHVISNEDSEQALRKLIAEDHVFFLSQRRMMRILAEKLKSPNSVWPNDDSIEDVLARQESETVEDKADDEDFNIRMNALIDRGLTFASACAEETDNESLRSECTRCSEVHCGCDACQISHVIICGLFTDDFKGKGTDEEWTSDSEGTELTALYSSLGGSGRFLLQNRYTKSEHITNAYGKWTTSDLVVEEDNSSEEDDAILSVIQEIEESTPSSSNLLNNAPQAVKDQVDKLTQIRAIREASKKEKIQRAMDMEFPDMSTIGTMKKYEVEVTGTIPNDGCRQLNEQLRRDIIQMDSLENVSSQLRDGTTPMIPYCCLAHRCEFRRTRINKDRLNNMLYDEKPSSEYPNTMTYEELNLMPSNELLLTTENFQGMYELDRKQTDFIRYSIKRLISGYSKAMKNFYTTSERKLQKSIQERVLKEATVAHQLLGEFASDFENSMSCAVSDTQDQIKKTANWNSIETRPSDREFLEMLSEFDLGVITALPRRGITFFFMQILYKRLLDDRMGKFKVGVVLYEPVVDAEKSNCITIELEKHSRLEALWMAMIFASSVEYNSEGLTFSQMQETANSMAEYIVLVQHDAGEMLYEPVSHFLNMCLIFNTLPYCMFRIYPNKQDLTHWMVKPEEQIWVMKADEEEDHIIASEGSKPNFRNPHHLSQKQMRQLKNAKLSLLEICEVNPDVVSTLKRHEYFIKDRLHLQERIIMGALVFKTLKLQEAIEDGKSEKITASIRRMVPKDVRESTTIYTRNVIDAYGEGDRADLDMLVDYIEGDENASKAKANKKAKKKLQKAARQAAEEERRKREQVERAAADEEQRRKTAEKAAERAKKKAEEEVKRKEREVKEKEKKQEKEKAPPVERKKKSHKKGRSMKKDVSPIVIEEPVYGGNGLTWYPSISKPASSSKDVPDEVSVTSATEPRDDKSDETRSEFSEAYDMVNGAVDEIKDPQDVPICSQASSFSELISEQTSSLNGSFNKDKDVYTSSNTNPQAPRASKSAELHDPAIMSIVHSAIHSQPSPSTSMPPYYPQVPKTNGNNTSLISSEMENMRRMLAETSVPKTLADGAASHKSFPILDVPPGFSPLQPVLNAMKKNELTATSQRDPMSSCIADSVFSYFGKTAVMENPSLDMTSMLSLSPESKTEVDARAHHIAEQLQREAARSRENARLAETARIAQQEAQMRLKQAADAAAAQYQASMNQYAQSSQSAYGPIPQRSIASDSSYLQQNQRGFSNVTPSELQSLSMHQQRAAHAPVNQSYRHSYIEPSSNMQSNSLMHEDQSSFGRQSVPPDMYKFGNNGTGFPFGAMQNSTEDMYTSDDAFRRCTNSMFKSIWSSDLPTAYDCSSSIPNAQPAYSSNLNHQENSTGLTGVEFMRSSVPAAPEPISRPPIDNIYGSPSFYFKTNVHVPQHKY